jgi:asparagine synthetase B (glutamine-hydrolysing)
MLNKIKSKIRKNGIQFNCLVTNNHISSNGLEARVPFLDKEFVNMYLIIIQKKTIATCSRSLK